MLSLKSSEARGQARVDVDEQKDGWSNSILIHGEIDWRHFLIKTILSENACPLLSKQGSEGIVSWTGPVLHDCSWRFQHTTTNIYVTDLYYKWRGKYYGEISCWCRIAEKIRFEKEEWTGENVLLKTDLSKLISGEFLVDFAIGSLYFSTGEFEINIRCL